MRIALSDMALGILAHVLTCSGIALSVLDNMAVSYDSIP